MTAKRKEMGGFKLTHYQPHIRCNIAYTPWPSAYCPPHCTSFYLSNITSFVRQFIPLSANTDTGHLVLFQDCGSILLAVGWLDYIVITSYVSQLVNHLRTRTPMGDLVEQSRLALDSHYAYSIQTALSQFPRSCCSSFSFELGASCMSSLKLIK